eukprot:Sspe_Gene.80519::Locus_50895_Transcript_2_3_Confidence_0.400_Length_2207::g.80519::m.80519/K07635/FUT7; galactoside alpha-1,3-fucosyltransferase 7
MRRGVQRPTILVWHKPWCPVRKQRDPYCRPRTYLRPCSRHIREHCSITTKKHLLGTVDAVVVPVAARDPFDVKEVPDIPVVLMEVESPRSPLGRYHGNDTTVKFNWTMSYRQDSDVYMPYSWEIHYFKANYVRAWKRTVAKVKDKKVQGVAMVGNCVKWRMEQVEMLKEHFPVELRGRCWGQRGSDTLFNESLFHLAFENSRCLDYVTEKYWRAVTWGSIPVVNGPPEAYRGELFKDAGGIPAIHAYSFATAKDLADYMKQVASNETLLRYYTEYADRLPHPFDTGEADNVGWCALCRRLMEDTPRQYYDNISRWITQDGHACTTLPKWTTEK